MIATGTMPPPAAWLALLAREPRLLQLGVRPGPIHLTPERRAGLKAIQDGVNDGVRYQRDAAGRDVWGRTASMTAVRVPAGTSGASSAGRSAC